MLNEIFRLLCADSKLYLNAVCTLGVCVCMLLYSWIRSSENEEAYPPGIAIQFSVYVSQP